MQALETPSPVAPPVRTAPTREPSNPFLSIRGVSRSFAPTLRHGAPTLALQELLLGIWEAERKTVLFVTHDIDEAVFMGSRVVVMSARPGRIKLDREVPLAHPRHYLVKTTAPFVELKAELTEQVRTEVLAAQAAAV